MLQLGNKSKKKETYNNNNNNNVSLIYTRTKIFSLTCGKFNVINLDCLSKK